MIDKLIEDYEDFHDALILNFEYKTNIDLSDEFQQKTEKIYLTMSCFNLNENFIRQTINIEFKEIETFKFNKYTGMVMNLLIEKDNESYIFDFDPIILSVDKNSGKFILEKNPNSELVIKFKKLTFKVI